MSDLAPSGLSGVDALSWGTHVCDFYSTASDLRETLVPYFKAGLENNERCLVVAADPFSVEDVRSAMRAAIGDFDARETRGQIALKDALRWYEESGGFSAKEIVNGLLRTEEEALLAGYKGLRTNGNIGWLERDQWSGFQNYESLVTDSIKGRRMVCMCSYCLDKIDGHQTLNVIDRHDAVLRRRGDNWKALPTVDQSTQETLERQAVLIRELDHRAKNNLAIVQAIMTSTMRNATSMEVFQEVFTGRISALAKTQSLLTGKDKQGALLADLLHNDLDVFVGRDPTRVTLDGPPVSLPPRIAVPVSMAIHELTTNAVKYGALAALGGQLLISWRKEGDELLELDWQESNVADVREPARIGFGTQLVRRLLPGQIKATVDMRFEPDGLRVAMCIPLAREPNDP